MLSHSLQLTNSLKDVHCVNLIFQTIEVRGEERGNKSSDRAFKISDETDKVRKKSYNKIDKFHFHHLSPLTNYRTINTNEI